MSKELNEAVRQGIEKTKDILESSKAVKGKEFTDKVSVAFLSLLLQEMVKHRSGCSSPACKENSIADADFVFSKLMLVVFDGMSDADCNELTNLVVALRGATSITLPNPN